jgi:glycosyltransferase involved in cell wall biosynthesis
MPDLTHKEAESVVPPSVRAGCSEFAPRFSIVVPIHNEEGFLEGAITELVEELEARNIDYEIMLAENGSTDRTFEIADRIAGGSPRIRAISIPSADYGLAMKTGMLKSRGEFIVNFDVDFYDVGFMLEAGRLLASTDLGIVVGSKIMAGAIDRRSPARHAVSLGFTVALRLVFDPAMDDTHGMKVLRREVVREYGPQTIKTRDLFDTELIIRARRAKVGVAALPVTCIEKRKPRSSIVRRIPRTIRGLAGLRMTLWKEKGSGIRT